MEFRLPGRSGSTSPPASSPEDRDGSGAGGSTPAVAVSSSLSRVRSPLPSSERGPRLRAGVRAAAVASAHLLVIAAGLVVIGWVLGTLWPILLPIVLALLFATVLWPPTRLLRRLGFPPALAAVTVLLTFFAIVVGVFAWLIPQVADQAGEVADAATGGLEDVQQWVTGPPLNLGEDQIGQAVDSVIDSVQSNAQNIAGYALTGATAVGQVLLNLVLALVLTLFFIKDGPRWLPWLSAQSGLQVAPHVAALSYKIWNTLSEFIRQQALVGLADAVFIGLGLWILGVPLVLPLAVLTFIGAFIPIIGAFLAGGLAVLVALVSNGPTTALLVLVVVILVQQIEGNVLQPILQGRGLNLHAGVVILAVTAGGNLYGLVGIFLGVPVVALIAVVYRYIRDELDGRSPEVDEHGTRARLVGDESGTTVIRERVDAPTGGRPADPAATDAPRPGGGGNVAAPPVAGTRE